VFKKMMWKTSTGQLSKATIAVCSTFFNKEERKMDSLWEKANKVSELGGKVYSAAMVVELVATDIADNAPSGAAWCAVDTLTRISDELEALASEIMLENREKLECIRKLEAVIAKQKPKKKKKEVDMDGRC
jgi:hypothetical protein